MIQGRYSNPITALQAVISILFLLQTHTSTHKKHELDKYKNIYFLTVLNFCFLKKKVRLYHFKLVLNQQSSVLVIGLLESELNPPLSRDESPEQQRPHLVLFSRS